MLKRSFVLLTILFLAAGLAWADAAGNYNFIPAQALQKRIQENSPPIIIDICPAEQFAQGHIDGSIETNAYPVKTEAQKARLAACLPNIKTSADQVVIVCPRGAGGAKRTFDFYRANGVEISRLLILEKGMNGWPYKTVKK